MKILLTAFALYIQFVSFSQATENQIYSVILNSYKPYNKSKIVADSSMDRERATIGLYLKRDGYDDQLLNFLKHNPKWASIIENLPKRFPEGKIAINRNLKLKGKFTFYSADTFYASIKRKSSGSPESWWESFYEIYPNSQGLFTLSKIYFPKRNKAIAMLWKSHGYDEASEDLKLLEFKNNEWTLIYTHRMLDGF